ncbi:MAG: type I restriction endonuclease subunit R [Xenococcus sp. (in: cyanobacteria)]
MTAKDDRWNEETLSERPAVELLESLEYRYLSPEEIEPLREGERSGILIKPLQESLFRINPWLSKDNCDRAIRTITKINAVNLIEANEQAYNILTFGTTVLQDLGSGMTSQTVRFIDFDNPIENQYIELDTQITGTFQRVGFPNPQRAESVKNLRELLRKGTGMTILTTVQKFYDATRSKKPLNSGLNVFVLVDEAHRTQYGLMAARMRRALDNATFIAFTGTPIDKKDRSTLQEFGSYIHKYPIAQSVKDKATVPIFYESRDLKKFGVWGNSIDTLFNRYFGHYSPEEQEKIKSRYATSSTIASSPQRIATIALDLVQHFEQVIHVNKFRGQIVTVNREAAVRYKAELDKLDAPESVVIFTSSHNDNKELASHRTTPAERKQLIERFKNPNDPLSLIIVVDMFLTGFDAPIEQVMYLDAPLKEHNLLQAIARVNRPYEGKEAGFIVDYYGVSEHLSEALSLFDENELGEPMQPKENELLILERHHRSVMRIFERCDRNNYEALFKIIEPEDIRTKFNRAYRAFASSLNLLYPDPEALDYEEDFKWLSKIRQAASNRFRDSNLDWDHIATKVRKLIDDNLVADGVEQVIEPISILEIEFDRNLETLPSDAAKASEIDHAIRYEINERETENPIFYASLKERLYSARL